MKYLVFVMMLGLAACQTTGGTGASVSDLQKAVRAACAFYPAAQTVAELLGKHIPYAEIISSICVAVGAVGGDSAHATYRAHGVHVKGRFVQ